MDNLISQQAAIDMIMGQPPEPHYPTWYAEQIKALPSTQPKVGTWLQYDTVPRYVLCKCSACGADILVPCRNEKAIFSFCPNCGAKMKEGN